MTTYNKFITEEGKNEILKIAFSDEGNENTFRYLALGMDSGQLASQTGNKADFVELPLSDYHRIGTDNNTENTVLFDNNGTATISFIFTEENYNKEEGVTIKEIALCNDADADISGEMCKVFAFCEVPPIQKTGSISLKYTLKISIE